MLPRAKRTHFKTRSGGRSVHGKAGEGSGVWADSEWAAWRDKGPATKLRAQQGRGGSDRVDVGTAAGTSP
ncbi:hypothetical protein E2C01_101548 [Portunus trituberculatus]|uniref:Uncharacterized protein n=1 Tax=Portunus trituberculatus TaxID=210409 RepID=A0A5B7KB12_PORTR|nr:hypothetical protein [Portunus trituberculatus]